MDQPKCEVAKTKKKQKKNHGFRHITVFFFPTIDIEADKPMKREGRPSCCWLFLEEHISDVIFPYMDMCLIYIVLTGLVQSG